jgi:hypothetical protein
MTDPSAPTRPLQAPGRLVSQRLAHWRSQTWAELEELMSAPDDAGSRPHTESLVAPRPRAHLVRE